MAIVAPVPISGPSHATRRGSLAYAPMDLSEVFAQTRLPENFVGAVYGNYGLFERVRVSEKSWTLGAPSRAQAVEIAQLTDYFVKFVLCNMEGLGDPYGGNPSFDPFDYKSVPTSIIRTVSAAPTHIGRLRPFPMTDE